MSFAPRISSAMRIALGGNIDRPIRPLIITVLIGSMARSVMISFTAIWASSQLLATDRQLATAYAIAGITAAIAGYAAGSWADRIGSRRVLILGWGVQSGVFAAFATAEDHIGFGLALIVTTTALATLCTTVSQTAVTELVSSQRRTAGFAALRLGQNLGYATGPLAGALLLSFGWSVVFLAVSAVAIATTVISLFGVPTRGSVISRATDAERTPLRTMLTNRRFVALYIAGCLTMIVYSAQSVLLPVSLTQRYGVDPRVWGMLVIITPVLVIILQLRIVDILRNVGLLPQVAFAALLMGVPFLLLLVSSATVTIAFALVFYSLGVVIWAPAAQSLIVECSDSQHKGAALGAFASTLPIGLSLGPMVGFQVRAAWGDGVMWILNGVFAVAAAVIYLCIAASTPRSGANDTPITGKDKASAESA